ncbi:DUF7426 family protein [Actinoplanes sp. CA-252034]|uniref:DUF7426 family protein n=1 Tax=Actinoplanes sp. CA-252034 TaxID=3239906 RepID=UPI003D98E6C2
MAKLSGLSRYFNPGLELGGVPGRDGAEREYVVPLASAELGLWCQQLAEVAGRIHAASTPHEIQDVVDRIEHDLPKLDGHQTLAQRVLGTAYDQMMTDGVTHAHIQYCGHTAYAWIVGGEEAAARFWTSGGQSGEAARPANRAERRAAGRTNTAAANATNTPASTSGTRSRTRSSRSGRAKGGRGRRSSPTGT